MNDRDMAREIFLKLASQADFQIPSEVLSKVYEIEKSHQFDEPDDRGRSMKDLQSVIDAWLKTDMTGDKK